MAAHLSTADSRYVEKRDYLSRYTHERALPAPSAAGGPEGDPQWRRALERELPKFIPFLTRRCGLVFRGRILEIGAGGAWLSAELSKLPRVVEVITTDLSPHPLKEHAPKVFELLRANNRKITRMPGDFHRLDFPQDYFDFVVCSGALHQAANLVQVLREAKRLLKPGGQLVAIREPVWPLVKLKSRKKMMKKLVETGINDRHHTLADYKEFFKQAALPVAAKRVNLAGGLKYYMDELVNGLTHARYAFIATKRARAH